MILSITWTDIIAVNKIDRVCAALDNELNY